MGVVYRAEDLRLHRTVALKFMLPQYTSDDTGAARFLREARAVAALDHSNICTVHEVGESEEGHLFLAMSYYEGETLSDRLTRTGALPVEQALDIARQVARGLARAHGVGIVHRDLKPANLMLTADGTVKILDFGLAKARDQTLTATGAVMGTAAYMSPEQLWGGQVDARTDLWSLGVVLGEMLRGQHPFAVATQPQLPAAVAQIVDRLTRRDPAERYQSAEELLAHLEALQDNGGVPALNPKRSRRLIVGAGVATILLVASVFGIVQWRRSSRAAEGAAVTASATRPMSSLAVLPLKNYSGNPDQEYFSDGMTEELTTTLAKIEALRVIAHQSVRQFKRSERPLPEIARVLDVKYVVDGSVLQDGDRIRITANLIDAARNSQVWGESFQRERRDVMALQREVALAIAREIEVALTPQDRARLASTREVDPIAFDLYVRGTKARYDANFTGDFTEAARYLEQAIAADSGYAPAYAGLALIHAFGVLGVDEARARWYADRSVRLDPQLADAHVAVGTIRQNFEWDWDGSEQAFLEAIRLNPGHAEAHHELSMLLMRRKRFDEALSEAQRALYLAPTSTRFENGVGEVYVFSGQYDKALGTAGKLLATDTSFTGAYYVRGLAYEQLGKLEEAVDAWQECLRLAPLGCAFARVRLAYIDAMEGRRAEALRVVNTLKGRWQREKGRPTAGPVAMDVATVYAGLREPKEALDWLERATESGAFMLYIGIDPSFRSLDGEQRFQAVLKKIGLVE